MAADDKPEGAMRRMLKAFGLDSKRAGADAVASDKNEWSEDRSFIDAKLLAESGKKHEALQRLVDLTARKPNHEPAREKLVQLAADLGERAALEVHLGWAFTRYQAEPDKIVHLYRLSREKSPHARYDERTLVLALTAAAKLHDSVVVLEIAGRMLVEHARSSLMPRVLWDAARAQKERGRSDLARKTLRAIVDCYPTDPFARRAEGALGG